LLVDMQAAGRPSFVDSDKDDPRRRMGASLRRTATNWSVGPTHAVTTFERPAPPDALGRSVDFKTTCSDISGARPRSRPGYSVGKRSLPNGVHTSFSSTRCVDPQVQPDYRLPSGASAIELLGERGHPAPRAGRAPPEPIAGSWSSAPYQRHTKLDTLNYSDVYKSTSAKPREPRRDVIPDVDVGKPKPFDRSLRSNPLDPVYRYDLGLRAPKTAERPAAKPVQDEFLGRMETLVRGGCAGPAPDRAQRFRRANGITHMNQSEPFYSYY